MPLTRIPAGGVVTATTFTFNSLNVTATTVTASTITGALVISGGLGIGGSGYIGGNLTVLGTINATITGIASSATNIAGGTAGQVPYQSAAGTTSFYGPGTAGQILLSAGASAPVYTNTASVYVGAATGAVNLFGGTAGQLHYQSAPGTTSFLSTGTTGQLLVSAAGAPVWTSTGSLYVNRAVTADSASGSAGSVANALTIGTGLSGTAGTYNGSAAVTISLNTSTLVAIAVLAQTATTATNAGTAYSTIGTHSTGTGILGSSFNGSANQTWTLDTSTLMARAVQTVQSLSAGAGLTGSAFNGSTAQTWTLNTATLMANAVTATNLAGGSANQFAYQTSAGATSFVNTGSMYVGRAVLADSVTGSAGSLVNSVTFNNAGTGDASGTSYNGGAARTISYNTLGAMPTTGGTFSGPVTFSGAVTFSGSATYVYSTQTYYTDNIINLHVPPGGVNSSWFTDDGKDIGLRFHYYTASTDTNAALVLANDTKWLEWYSAGAEGTSTFAGSTYGNFKTGGVWATNNAGVGYTASQVGEKFGVNGGAYVNGTLTATTFVGSLSFSHSAGTGLTGSAYNGSSAQTWSLNTATLMASAVSAINLSGGSAMALPYQSASGTTTYLAAGTSGQILQTNGTGSAPTWVSISGLSAGTATNADNLRTIQQTASGIYYPSFVDSNNAAAAYEAHYTTSSFSINPANGNVSIGGILTATNIQVGTGVLIYTSGNQLLTPIPSSSIRTNASSGNIVINGGGGTGNAVYFGFDQTISGGTYFAQNGTTLAYVSTTSGLIINNGTTAYSGAQLSVNGGAYVNGIITGTSSVFVGGNIGLNQTGATRIFNNALATDSISLEGAGGITFKTYSSGFNTVGTWNTAGQLGIGSNYAGTSGALFAVNGGAYVNGILTATTFVGSFSGAVTGASTQVQTTARSVSATYFPTFVDTNNASAANEVLYTTSSFTINPGTGAVSFAGTLTQSGGYAYLGSFNSDPATAGRPVFGGASMALSWNFSGGNAEMNLWNTVNPSTYSSTGFRFLQQLTASTQRDLVFFRQDGAVGFGGVANVGTSGQVLQSNGAASPTWVSPTTLASASATNADNLRTVQQTASGTYYPAFVDSNNSTAAYEAYYTTSSFSINPATGLTTIAAPIGGDGVPALRITQGTAPGTFNWISSYLNSSLTAGKNLISLIGQAESGNNSAYFGFKYVGAGSASNFATIGMYGADNLVNILASGFVGIGNTAPGFKLSVNTAADVWHAQFGTSGGKQLRIGGSTTAGSVIGAYNDDTNSSPATLLLQRDGGSVGIGVSSTAGKLHVGGAGNSLGGNIHLGDNTDAAAKWTYITAAHYNGATNATGVSLIGHYASSTDNSISIGGNIYEAHPATNIQFYTYTSNTHTLGGTLRLTITKNGGFAFGTSASNYGSSGQILQSNGDAAPTWVNASTIAAGSAPLTNTYVGFGSASNLLTGSSSLTWNGSTLYVNGRIQTPGYKTYNVTTGGQGNVNSTYEIMRISRDSANWSTNMGYEVTVRSAYYNSGGMTKWYIVYGYDSAGAITCMDARGGTKHRVYLGAEVTVSGNIKYIPVYVDIPNYFQVAIEVKYNTTEVTTINGSGQVYFTGTMAVGTGSLYGGDTHLVPNGGNIGINSTSPSARLHVVDSTPTSIGSVPAGTTAIMDSNTNNYLLFRNTADNGTYSGLAFQDNNMGGYVLFGNAGGGGDQLWIAGYGGGALQYGTTDSIDRTARSTALSWNSSGVNLNGAISFNGTSNYGTAGQILKSNGNAAPTWVDQSTISAGSATDNTKVLKAGDTMTGALTMATSNYIRFGPNPTWSSTLQVGGDGRGAITNATGFASVVTTNGNLHLDSGTDKAMYLNFYSGTAGVLFGNGASTYNASVSAAGVFSGKGLNVIAPDDVTSNFSNVDSDSAAYTSRQNRVLTSNGSNWVADGKDPVISITRNNGGTTRGQSIGLLLHNENNTAGSYSPLIGFSAVSNSGSYNSMYAAIMGKKTGYNTGVDTNWNKGELHFYTAGDVYMADTPTATLTSSGLGIGTGAGARLHLGTTADGESVFKISGTGGTNATVKFADVDIGGQGYGGAYLAWGRGGSYDNWFMVFTRTSGNTSAERLRITANGGVAFGGGSNYGSSGQVLQSNGDGPPTWVNPSGLAVSSIANFTAATSGNPLNASSPPTIDAIGYVSSNIPTSYGLGGSVGSQSDGGLYVAGYSTDWYHEIYGDFRTGGIAVRGKYSGTWQSWRNVPCISIQDTAPSIYNPGDLWWESDTGRLKVLYYDGTSSQWVDAVPVINTSLFFSKSGGAISGPVSINGALSVTGNITATAEITAYYSDRRLKTDVLTIENALVKVKKLNGVTYRPNELAESYGLGTNSDVVGLFADEVEQVLPQAVKPAPFDIDENGNSKSGENYKTIQYEKVVPLLVEAIKEQQSIIEAQQAKIDRLMKHLGLED